MTGVAKNEHSRVFITGNEPETGNILMKLLRALPNTHTFLLESTTFIPVVQVLLSGEKDGDRESFLSYLLQDRLPVSIYTLGPTYRAIVYSRTNLRCPRGDLREG